MCLICYLVSGQLFTAEGYLGFCYIYSLFLYFKPKVFFQVHFSSPCIFIASQGSLLSHELQGNSLVAIICYLIEAIFCYLKLFFQSNSI